MPLNTEADSTLSHPPPSHVHLWMSPQVQWV